MRRRTAVVVLCSLFAAGAVGSQFLGDPPGRLTGTLRLPRPLAESIPLDLGGWRGVDDPMDRHALEITRVDDYVRRRYTDERGEEVLAYVAFHGNKARGMETYYHNVTVCFPSAGWELVSETPGTETLHDLAKQVPVSRYVFRRGATRLSVLTFFKVDDELLDRSPRNKPLWTLGEKLFRAFDDSPGTFVQVQIVAEVRGAEADAAGLQSRFLRDFGASIFRAVEVGAAQ